MYEKTDKGDDEYHNQRERVQGKRDVCLQARHFHPWPEGLGKCVACRRRSYKRYTDKHWPLQPEIPTEPAPIKVTPCLARRGPAMTRVQKPAKGRAGMSQSSSSISVPHPSGSVRIKGPEAAEEPQDQCQTYRHFCRCHRKYKNEHYLTVRLVPARCCNDKGEAAAFSMISTDMRMKIIFLRMRTPVSPSAKSTPARRRQNSPETLFMSSSFYSCFSCISSVTVGNPPLPLPRGESNMVSSQGGTKHGPLLGGAGGWVAAAGRDDRPR